jgi:predicted DNA binding protein
MFEVVFKAAHDGFYSNLSRRFPSFRKFFWCNYSNDIIEILVDDTEEYRLVMDEVAKYKPSGIIEESIDQMKFHLVVKNCTCTDENTVGKYMGSLDVLHVFPVITEKGWEYHRVLFFKHEDFEELVQRLTENGFIIEILRKVPFDGYIGGSLALNTDTLMSDLTEKQVDALLTAYKYGYYYLPRKADVQTIANKIQVPRTTFQEHLKKAENKLMAALVPYVQMFKHSTSDQKKRLKITVDG